MDKELSQEDLIVKEEKKDALTKASPVTLVPANYIEIKLSSIGKLSAPVKLHFRNYTMGEAFDLARMTAENQDEIIIGILNKMVYQDFDCKELHREEVKEIMLNIYSAFWGNTIENLNYYVNEELDDDLKSEKKNISLASIPITNIEIKDLNPDYREPFYLEEGDNKYGFILPRIENSIIAKNYVTELFAAEESRFSTIKYHLKHNAQAPPDKQKIIDYIELQELTEYQRLKATEKLRVLQALMLHSVNGIVLETLDQKYEKAGTLDLRVWEEFNTVVENELKFGINKDVTFICSITKKEITRRFQFRELEFIPPVGKHRDTKYTLSFS